VKDHLFFFFEQELWKSDGTEAGSAKVSNFISNPDSSPKNLITLNKTLFFFLPITNTGLELWKSNGMKSNTSLIKVIQSNEKSAAIRNPIRIGGNLFFFVDETRRLSLWKSDGTEAGTIPVKQFNRSLDMR
jgi:ELWxxDGT repeat protein